MKQALNAWLQTLENNSVQTMTQQSEAQRWVVHDLEQSVFFRIAVLFLRLTIMLFEVYLRSDYMTEGVLIMT